MKFILIFLKRIWEFLKEVKTELNRVTWPTRSEIFRFTIIVIVLSLIAAAFFGGFDFLINYLMNRFIL